MQYLNMAKIMWYAFDWFFVYIGEKKCKWVGRRWYGIRNKSNEKTFGSFEKESKGTVNVESNKYVIKSYKVIIYMYHRG